MIPYKGHFCGIKQYMKAKPVKFGIKCLTLSSVHSRYIYNVIVYMGTGDRRTKPDQVSKDAVLVAVRGLEQQGHVIITDNFFMSLILFLELMAQGFWAIGTCKKTRRGFAMLLAGFASAQAPN